MRQDIVKKSLSVILAFLMVVCIFPLTIPFKVSAAISGKWTDPGNFTPVTAGNLTITTEAQLAGFAVAVNSGIDFWGYTVTLANDLDLSSHFWTPIGNTDSFYGNCFKGTFNGGGHKISNLSIGTASTPEAAYAFAGLFGYVYGSTISDVLLIDVAIYTLYNAGGLVGCWNGTDGIATSLSNCYVSGTVSVADEYAGGLVGRADYCAVSNCGAAVNVTGGVLTAAGGLLGFFGTPGSVTNCYATGNVSSSSNSCVGGLIGLLSMARAINCYAAGRASGQAYIGGFVGYNDLGIIENCYYNTTAGNARGSSHTSDTTTPKTSDQMKDASFVTLLNTGFSGTWAVDTTFSNQGFPVLTTFMDATAPTVSNKTIVASTLTYESVTLGWSKATDNKSAQNALQYLVYRSSSNNIGTVADIEANGTPIGTYAVDISSKSITGLTAEITYYFNIIVKDEVGNKTCYTTKSIATPEAPDTTPPIVLNKTITVSNLTHNNVTLGWSKATDNKTAQSALRYSIYFSVLNNISTVSEIISNGIYIWSGKNLSELSFTVLPNTTYYYNVIVKDEAGNMTCYTTKSVATPEAPDTTAPTVSDMTISASNLTFESVTLGWSKATDNKSAQNALQYLVYRSSSNNIGTVTDIEANGTPIGTYAADISSKDIIGLIAETTYYINIIVKDEAGNKTCYTTKSITTPEAPDTIAPTVSNKTIVSSDLTCYHVTLGWSKATDDKSAQTALIYKLYWSYNDNINTLDDIETNGTFCANLYNYTSTNISGMKPETTYYFNVIVLDQAGNKTAYTAIKVTTLQTPDITPPTVSDKTISTSNLTHNSVTLGWSKATDNRSAQSALQYLVYWSSSNNLDTVANIESNGTALGDYAADISLLNLTALTPETTYYFNLIVKDEAGNKTCYTSKSVTTPEAPDTASPTVAHKIITASYLTQSSVTLEWNKATDNKSAQLALHYLVYMSNSGNLGTVADIETNGTPVGMYTANITSKLITGLTAQATYYFNVIVKDEAGNKACYTIKAITTPAAPTESVPISANAAQNNFSADKTAVAPGQSVTLTAAGDRQNAAGSTLNDERYIPVSWSSTEAGKSGGFTVNGGVYTSTYTPSAAGIYTVTAVFQRQMFNGSIWININGDLDKKSVTVTAEQKQDNSSPAVPIGPTTATIGASDINTDKDVIFILGNIHVTAPASVCKAILGNDTASTLKMTMRQSDNVTLGMAEENLGTGSAVITGFELTLEKGYPDGRTEQIRNFKGKLKVSVNLTDSQISAIQDQSQARLYWYDSSTGKLTDMKAMFDFNAKTATFYTDHFSTFLIAEINRAAGTDVEAPNMGDTGFDFSILIALISIVAALTILAIERRGQKRLY